MKQTKKEEREKDSTRDERARNKEEERRRRKRAKANGGERIEGPREAVAAVAFLLTLHVSLSLSHVCLLPLNQTPSPLHLCASSLSLSLSFLHSPSHSLCLTVRSGTPADTHVCCGECKSLLLQRQRQQRERETLFRLPLSHPPSLDSLSSSLNFVSLLPPSDCRSLSLCVCACVFAHASEMCARVSLCVCVIPRSI